MENEHAPINDGNCRVNVHSCIMDWRGKDWSAPKSHLMIIVQVAFLYCSQSTGARNNMEYWATLFILSSYYVVCVINWTKRWWVLNILNTIKHTQHHSHNGSGTPPSNAWQCVLSPGVMVTRSWSRPPNITGKYEQNLACTTRYSCVVTYSSKDKTFPLQILNFSQQCDIWVQSSRMWCCTTKFFMIFRRNVLPSCLRFQDWNLNPWITYTVMYHHIQKIKTVTVSFIGFRVSQWCNVYVDPVFGWLHHVNMVSTAAQ
jgi:hypothetical protein